MNEWQPGARAAIIVTEWPRNMFRVVELHSPLAVHMGNGWIVTDPLGGTFDGYQVYSHDNTKTNGQMIVRPVLGIAQWKLRLVNGDDRVREFLGSLYLEMEI
jgi:hypothetical protein